MALLHFRSQEAVRRMTKRWLEIGRREICRNERFNGETGTGSRICDIYNIYDSRNDFDIIQLSCKP